MCFIYVLAYCLNKNFFLVDREITNINTKNIISWIFKEISLNYTNIFIFHKMQGTFFKKIKKDKI